MTTTLASAFGVTSNASEARDYFRSNNFEAKVKDNDSTATGPRKIVLLNNLNLSTSHNFAADSLRWSPVRMGTMFSLLKNKMKIK